MDDLTQRVMRLEHGYTHLDKTLTKLDATMEKQVQSNLTLSGEFKKKLRSLI